jgi:hypothetical protein
MRFASIVLLSLLAASPAMPALAATRPHHVLAASHKSGKRPAVKTKLSGQRTIDDDRATQIQAALIRAGYLTGTPSGHWDADSIAAMTKVQADNGWQTKLVPDSRALIKLGLGPVTSAASFASPSPTVATATSPAPLSQTQ